MCSKARVVFRCCHECTTQISMLTSRARCDALQLTLP
jgi:hypothetical protein